MIKRLKWLVFGYVLGIFTFDILKRFLEENYGDSKGYQTFTSALASISDFQKSKTSLQDYVEDN